jgi:3-oxoacyl-[acyl-carrier protein] reductase
MELKNKVALITGAARGIGKAIALEFAKEGAKVVLADIDIDNCEFVSDEIKKLGFDSLPLECDVTNSSDVQKMIKIIIKKLQKIDILVNCASEEIIKPFLIMTEKEWDNSINVNIKGTFLPTLFVARKMVEQKKGKIISITSIAGEVGLTYASSFCATKAAIINLTKELALELSEHKINVNSIVSGVLPTEMAEDILSDKQTKKEMIENTPLGRIGKPKDIARTAVFLASEKSNYITGHNLVVDGGWLSK